MPDQRKMNTIEIVRAGRNFRYDDLQIIPDGQYGAAVELCIHRRNSRPKLELVRSRKLL